MIWSEAWGAVAGELKGGYEILEVPLPCVVSVKTACNEARFMDFHRKPWAFKEAQVTYWNAADLEAEANCIGLAGSPTIVTGLAEAPSRDRKREFLEGSPDEVIAQLVALLEEV